MINSFHIHVFKQLLWTDLKIFSQLINDKIINFIIWVTTAAWVNTYLMTAFGVNEEFAAFMVAGSCATAGFFEIYPSVIHWVSDIEGDQIISYYLTLPIPAWLMLIRMIVFFAISAGTLSIIVLPLCKLMLWNKFDLSAFNIAQFLSIFVTMNVFYGAFTLMVTSYVKNMSSLGNVWMRFVYPVWFLGGFQYAWGTLHKTSPVFAYLGLINPMTYVMEATRGSILGQAGYLPFWSCIGIVMIFTVLCTWVGIVRLKKRLDFI